MPSSGESCGNCPATCMIASCALAIAARIDAAVTAGGGGIRGQQGRRQNRRAPAPASPVSAACCSGTKVAPDIVPATSGSAASLACSALAAARLGTSASA